MFYPSKLLLHNSKRTSVCVSPLLFWKTIEGSEGYLCIIIHTLLHCFVVKITRNFRRCVRGERHAVLSGMRSGVYFRLFLGIVQNCTRFLSTKQQQQTVLSRKKTPLVEFIGL